MKKMGGFSLLLADYYYSLNIAQDTRIGRAYVRLSIDLIRKKKEAILVCAAAIKGS
jgi:acyl-coenzyme A thioesterase PaaI-like protein